MEVLVVTIVTSIYSLDLFCHCCVGGGVEGCIEKGLKKLNMLLFWVINFINLSLDCEFRHVVFRIAKRKKNGATTLYNTIHRLEV